MSARPSIYPLFILSLIHPAIHSFVLSLVRSSVRLSMHLFIHPVSYLKCTFILSYLDEDMFDIRIFYIMMNACYVFVRNKTILELADVYYK